MENNGSRNLLTFKLPRNSAATYYIESLKYALQLQKMSKYWGLEKDGARYKGQFVLTDNCTNRMWNKVKKPSEIGQDLRTLICNVL